MNPSSKLPVGIAILADCKPRVIAHGGVLQVNATLEGIPQGFEVPHALQLRMLDEEGETRLTEQIPAASGGSADYHLSLPISDGISPGQYDIAVSVPGENTAALLEITVFDITESYFPLRAAFEYRTRSRESIEKGNASEAVRLLEDAVNLYEQAGADAAAWQAWTDLGKLQLDAGDYSAAKRATNRALELLEVLRYPPAARRRCEEQLAQIDAQAEKQSPATQSRTRK